MKATRRTRTRLAAALAPALALASLACAETEPLGLEQHAAGTAISERARAASYSKNSIGPGIGGASFSIGAMSGGLTTEDLSIHSAEDVANALVGAGVVISNVNYAGANIAAGMFRGGAGVIGFDEGIILSTGYIGYVIGPNSSGGMTSVNSTPGDAALSALAGFATYDAAILEFDFVPDADRIFFEYVFASEEYNEYVNSMYNDVFAFWVNGVNCAVVGANDDPVSINTINNGWNPIGSGASNPHLYINNDPFHGGVAQADLLDTEMDGLTVVLTCEAAVNAGQTNTMRLAIADGSDALLDSNVFIRAGSLTTTPPGGGNGGEGGNGGGNGEPGGPTEGCSPGYWGQNGVRTDAYPAPYAASQTVGSVFSGATGYLGDATLLDALHGYKASKMQRSSIAGASEVLLRQAVAAVLNEAKFGADYPAASVDAIREAVNAVLTAGDRKSILDLATQYDMWNNNLMEEAGELISIGSCPL